MKGGGAGAATFRGIVEKVDRLQQEMCARVKVGMPYERLHNESHDLLARTLKEAGIVKASEDELVSSGVTRKFLPHGLGHSLGLQTHDVGCLARPPRDENPWLRNTTSIEVGQVFTIEPGCYFIDAMMEEVKTGPLGSRVDWALVAELKKFGGVRIEDDLVVGASGVTNLTREFLP